MILIGQYDSPFVRRVGIALTLYRIAFDHRPWSVFADAEKIRAINPLMRVPTLVLPDGLALVDSHMMLDHLDGLVEAPLFPRAGQARTQAVRRAALACGAAKKAVALFYEQRLHAEPSATWQDRCRLQIGSVLSALEVEEAHRPAATALPGHDDIALACTLRFIAEAHPAFDLTHYPRITTRAAALERLEVFQTIRQPFIPPT